MNYKVEIDQVAHKYRINGVIPPISITGLVDKLNPFPKELLAKKVAEKEDRTVESVLAEWKLKGDVACSYGNALHLAMECYLKFGTVPKGLFAKRVVEAYDRLGYRDALAEVVVFDKGFNVSGMIDGFKIVGDKRCKIFDYKTFASVYKDGEPTGKIDNAKKKKTGLQLSIQEVLLNMWGWEVEDRVLLWWFDDEFHEYSLPFDDRAVDLVDDVM